MGTIFPLWADDNTTQFSSLFNVPPGFSCLLTADGLSLDAYRQSATEVKSAQTACVRRVLFDFDKRSVYEHQSRKVSNRLHCDWIYDISQAVAEEMSNLQLYSCCEPWSLTKLNNVKVIGIPGTYCIMLNDPTAVGVAQVYAEQIANDAVQPGAFDRLFFP